MRILIAISFLLVSTGGHAATKTWTGATNSDWNTGSNWGGTAPAAGDIANIPGGLSNYPIINNTVNITTVNINSSGSGATITVTTGGSFTVSGLLTVNANGTFTISGGTATLTGITASGAVVVSGGTITSTVNITLNSGATLNQSGGLIHMATNTGTNPTDNVIISGGATLTQSGGTLYLKDYTASAGTFNQTGSGALFKIFHDWKPGAGSVFNSTAGTVQFTGSGGGGPNFAAGSRQFTNLVVDAGVDPVFSNVASSTVPVAGNFTNNNSSLVNTTNVVFTFNGTGTQTITNASSNDITGDLVVNKSGGSLVLASDISVAGDVILTSGTLDAATNTRNITVAGNWTNNGGTYSGGTAKVTLAAAAGTIGGTTSTSFAALNVADAGVYTMNNSNSCSSLTFDVSANNSSLTLANGTTLTVTNDLTLNQPSASKIVALNINAATVTVNGNISFAGSNISSGRIAKIVITTGTLNANGGLSFTGSHVATKVIDMSGGAGILNLKGSLTVPAASCTLTAGTSGSTFNYTDNAAQTINFFTAGAYHNLTINNTHASGATLSAAITTSNVTGSISVGNNNAGSLFVTGNYAVGINNSKTLTVAAASIMDAGTSIVSFGTSGTATINGTCKTANTTGFSGSAAAAINSTNSPTISLGSNSTVEYNAAGAQTVTQRTDYANVTLTGGSKTIASGTITIAKNLTINTGATYLGSTNNPTLNIGGDFSNSGTFTQGTALVSFNGTAAQAIGGSSTTTFSNAVTVSNTSAALTANTSFNVNGTFTINASAVLNPAATVIAGGTGTLTGSGKVKVTRIAATPDFATQYTISNKTLTNLTVEYIGAGDQTVTALNYGHLTISQNGTRTVTLAGSGTIGVSGIFSPASATTSYTIAGSTIDFNGSGAQTVPAFNYNNLTVTLNGTRTITLASSGTVGIAGVFSPAGGATSYTNTGSTIDFNGSSAQNIPAFAFNNLTVSSSAKTATGVLTVNGTFTLNTAVLTTTSSNLLVINDNATATGAGYTAYVNGPVKKVGNDAFSFPVGKAGTGYMLIGISAPSLATDAFTAEYMRSPATGLGTITAPGLNFISNCDYWNLDRTTGTSNVDVTLSWNGYSNCNVAAYVTDLSTLTIAHYNGTSWDTHGKNSTTGNVSSGTITRNAVSAFSPFTLGSTGGTSNPLLVKFTAIRAVMQAGKVKVSWSNQSEINIAHYEIERSLNRIDFNTAGLKAASVNSGNSASYEWPDTAVIRTSVFYRIKAISTDGSFIYSTIVKADPDQLPELVIYPNPVEGKKLVVQAGEATTGHYQVQVFDLYGRSVFNRDFINSGSSFSQAIDLPSGIKPGVYTLRICNNQQSQVKPFILK